MQQSVSENFLMDIDSGCSGWTDLEVQCDMVRQIILLTYYLSEGDHCVNPSLASCHQLATHIQRSDTRYVKSSRMRQNDRKSKGQHNRGTPYSEHGSVQQDVLGA